MYKIVINPVKIAVLNSPPTIVKFVGYLMMTMKRNKYFIARNAELVGLAKERKIIIATIVKGVCLLNLKIIINALNLDITVQYALKICMIHVMK